MHAPAGWVVEERPPPINLSPEDSRYFRRHFYHAVPEAHTLTHPDAHLFVPARGSKGRFLSRWMAQNKPPEELEIPFGDRYSAKSMTKKVDKGVWVFGPSASNYFHWLTEDFVRLVLSESLAAGFTVLVPPHALRFSYVRETLQRFPGDILCLERRSVYWIRELRTINLDTEPGNFRTAYIQQARTAADNIFPEGGSSKARRRLWVSRGRAKKRRLLNEKLLKPVLEEFEIEVVSPDNLSLAEQVAMFRRASFIGGLHGAGLSNQFFMATGGKILEVKSSSDPHNNCYHSLASTLGHEYYYSIGSSRSSLRNSAVSVEPGVLRSALQQVFDSD